MSGMAYDLIFGRTKRDWSCGSFLVPVKHVETIVMVRHGEKPVKGLGQLNCQGINRSMALPHILVAKFGKPRFIFAPNPRPQKNDKGILYDYVRPLATIEPTAAQLGLPVDTRFGFHDIEGLHGELLSPKYQDATIFVAWEHHLIVDLIKHLLSRTGGDSSKVPDWKDGDFDSIYVVKVFRTPDGTRSEFFRDRQGLDDLPLVCPPLHPINKFALGAACAVMGTFTIIDLFKL